MKRHVVRMVLCLEGSADEEGRAIFLDYVEELRKVLRVHFVINDKFCRGLGVLRR